MPGRPRGELTEKHWKILKLLEEGGRTRKDIAKAVGIGEDYLAELCAGNIEKAGHVAVLFKKEYDVIGAKRDENIRELHREATQIAISNILSILSDFQVKKAKEGLTPEEKKLNGTLLNALSNNNSSVKINNLSYSYVSGLTPEEMLHEFTRLKSLTESSFNRGRIQDAVEGGTRGLPEVDES